MAILTAGYTVEWLISTTWVDITASVPQVSDGDNALSGGSDNPLAFGDSAESSCRVTIIDTLTAGADVTGRAIRVAFTMGATTARAFVGTIQEQAESTSAATIDLSCTGAAEALRISKAYTPAFFLRPIATKTTITSQEDYSLPGYVAGLMNYALWRAGGRPYEQAGTYTGAAFYYSLDQAILAPRWSWLAGEDGWAEVQKLAQAAGGQVYQDALGVVRYKQPLNIHGTASGYTFDNTQYGGATRSRKRGQVATKVIVTYLPREARPLQEVVSDTAPRLIHDTETITITLEPQWPLKSLEINTGIKDIADMDGNENLGTSALIVTDLTGAVVAQGVDGYGHELICAAQQITIHITNFASRPIVVWRTTLRGEPITAGEAGTYTAGAGSAERQVSDNPYIQSAAHAERLAQLILAFYGATGTAVELSGCVYDPARQVGEVVGFTASRWSVTNVAHVIVRMAHEDTGAGASYTLAPVAALPAAADYYTISASAQAGPKLVAY